MILARIPWTPWNLSWSLRRSFISRRTREEIIHFAANAPMTFKRVVITGLGALTPIGSTLREYWDGLKDGKSGAAPITKFDTTLFKTKFACELKGFDPANFMDKKDARKLDPFAQYA